MRLIEPCSSSSSMKVTPFAVAGRWRATTIPATRTVDPLRVRSRSALVRISAGRPGRISSIGCSRSVTLVDP